MSSSNPEYRILGCPFDLTTSTIETNCLNAKYPPVGVSLVTVPPESNVAVCPHVIQCYIAYLIYLAKEAEKRSQEPNTYVVI